MAWEELVAEAQMLLEGSEGDTPDRETVLERLRETLGQMRAMGQTPPAELVRLEQALENDLEGDSGTEA